jgi:hypothetical protein
MQLEAFDDAANFVFVAAYLVKDILWLRILSIVGSLVVLPYYLLQPEPLWTPGNFIQKTVAGSSGCYASR